MQFIYKNGYCEYYSREIDIKYRCYVYIIVVTITTNNIIMIVKVAENRFILLFNRHIDFAYHCIVFNL